MSGIHKAMLSAILIVGFAIPANSQSETYLGMTSVLGIDEAKGLLKRIKFPS